MSEASAQKTYVALSPVERRGFDKVTALYVNRAVPPASEIRELLHCRLEMATKIRDIILQMIEEYKSANTKVPL